MKVLHLNLPPVPPELARQLLAPLGAELVVAECQTGEAVVEVARDVDAIIGAAVGKLFTAEVVGQLDRCRIVSLWSGSTDYLALDTFTAKGITVSFAADACTEEVADHGMAMMLALGRKLFLWDRIMREKEARYAGPTGKEHDDVIDLARPINRLSTRTVGCIGFGRAGVALATRCRGFGMRFIAHDPFLPVGAGAALGVELLSKEEVLAQSDFLHLYVPMKADTEHIIGEAELALMKPTSYLVNTSARAAVIDEAALLAALEGGRLAGAALDNLTMTLEEGAARNPLLDRDDVILSPHISHVSDESYDTMRHRVCEDVVRYFGGEWPALVANPAVREIVGTPPG